LRKNAFFTEGITSKFSVFWSSLLSPEMCAPRGAAYAFEVRHKAAASTVRTTRLNSAFKGVNTTLDASLFRLGRTYSHCLRLGA
jgi:hypothetical protein